MSIRLARPGDCPAINAIYNHYVTRSTCTYQTEPSTEVERAKWFEHHGTSYPVTVFENPHDVVGWGSLSPFHARAAYRFTVENSVYVHPDHQKKGIGRALLADLIDRARALGYRSIIAIISADQGPSLALHAGAGFREAGRLARVGYKFDRWLDVVYMQKEL